MFACPCCGYKTLPERQLYDICPICFWEDDLVQYEDPDYAGGANGLSLKQSQRNFLIYGACERRFLQKVRTPRITDERDRYWRPIVEPDRIRYLCLRFIQQELELEEYISRLQTANVPEELESKYNSLLNQLEDIRWTAGNEDAIDSVKKFIVELQGFYPE